MTAKLFGAVSLGKGNLAPGEATFDASIVVEGFFEVLVHNPEGKRFVKIFNEDDLLILVAGYFDQPLYEDKVISIESIVADYRRNGELPGIDLFGSFQLVLVDKSKRRVFLSCDRDGLRNLYYLLVDDVLYFANKIGLFNDFGPAHSCRPNEEDRDFALIYGFYPGESTVYDSVKKLGGDSYLVIDQAGMTKRSHAGRRILWEVDFLDRESVVAQLYVDLMAAVKKQTEGFSRVAVLLGGFDSALLASMLKSLGKEVETYTFRFSDPSFNQTHTDTLANFLGIRHHWIDISPEIFGRRLPRYSRYFDQPTNWVNYVVQTLYVVQCIKDDGFDVCLTGDGCDTIFQGYPGVNRSAKFYEQVAPYIKPISQFLIRVADWRLLEAQLGHIYRLLLRIIRNAAADDPIRTFLMYRIFDETTIARVFKGSMLRDISRNVKTSLEVVAAGIPKGASRNRLAYLGRSNMGPNRAKLSGAMDATGVLLKSPFLHNEIKRSVGCYPEELFRPAGSGHTMDDIGKYVLTQMAERYGLLPKEVIYQKKQSPVNSPIDDWYRGELRESVNAILGRSPWPIDEKFVVRALMAKKWTEEFYKKKYSPDKVTSHALSLLVTTLAFYEE